MVSGFEIAIMKCLRHVEDFRIDNLIRYNFNMDVISRGRNVL